MEKFFYNGRFYYDLEEFMDDYLDDSQEFDVSVVALPNDWEVICNEAVLEPVVTLTADWIIDRIDDERWAEDGYEYDEVYRVLSKTDFSKINESVPKLWYESNEKFTITKDDLLKEIQ